MRMTTASSRDGVSLRGFEAAHLDDLVQMWRTSFEHGVGIRDWHSLEEQRAYFMREVLPNNDVRLAFEADRLVAFIAATDRSIAQLYVDVRHHGKGIGSGLLNWAKDRSAGTLTLYTFARNQMARAFYERHGFVAVALGFEPMWQLDDVKYQWERP